MRVGCPEPNGRASGNSGAAVLQNQVLMIIGYYIVNSRNRATRYDLFDILYAHLAVQKTLLGWHQRAKLESALQIVPPAARSPDET